MKEEKSVLSTISLVLAIIGICLSFIPIVNNVSFVLGLLAVIFAIVCLCQKKSKSKSIVALVIAILAIVITLSLQSSWSKSLDDLSNNMDGTNTEKILKEDVDVTLGDFVATDDGYGYYDTKMTVTVKNKSSQKNSYSIKIEAVDKDGNRIDDDTVYASDLTSGQSQNFDIFTFVTSEKVESLKNATFKILEVTK